MKSKMLLVVSSVAIVLLAAVAVTASSSISTPLYTVRMEQVSSKMNFLPTQMNGFTYTAEKGSILNYNVSNRCFAAPLAPTNGGGETCWPQCDTSQPTCSTCDETCSSTCPYTCSGETCSDTCGQKVTCDWYTCYVPTCDWYTCYVPTCYWPTCYGC